MFLLSGVVLGKRGLQNAKEGGVGSLGTWSLIMVYLCWHLLVSPSVWSHWSTMAEQSPLMFPSTGTFRCAGAQGHVSVTLRCVGNCLQPPGHRMAYRSLGCLRPACPFTMGLGIGDPGVLPLPQGLPRKRAQLPLFSNPSRHIAPFLVQMTLICPAW